MMIKTKSRTFKVNWQHKSPFCFFEDIDFISQKMRWFFTSAFFLPENYKLL